MKKVFRLWKFAKDIGNLSQVLLIESLKLNWPIQCDGLTAREMKLLGYNTADSWMEEVEDEEVEDEEVEDEEVEDEEVEGEK